jgi:anti-sigma regulatory factor (Ser/Thr protein kinase)
MSDSPQNITGETLEMTITSDPANLAPTRKAIEAFCLAHGLDQKAADEVGLCFNEAMANVTRHAYAGATDQPVLVGVKQVLDTVLVTIRDWGNGVNPETRPRRKKDPMVPGGLGLICLHELLDDLHYAPQPDGGMLLTMVKRRSDAP